MKKNIEDILKEKVLVLDGAMNSMIKKYHLKERDYKGKRFIEHKLDLMGCNEILSFTKQEIIKDIHEKYLKFGADIIETNTFNANRIYLSKFDLADIAYELNYTSATIAKEKTSKYANLSRNKPRFVAGAIGPIETNDDNFDEVVYAYSEQIKGLLAGRVDFLLIETISNETNLKAILIALDNILKKRRKHFPIFISGLISENNNSPITKDLINRYSAFTTYVNVLGIGVNCNYYPEKMYSQLKEISKNTNLHTIIYPNAIQIDKDSQELSSDEMIKFLSKFVEQKIVGIVGSCCGSTPEYTSKIKTLVKKFE